MAKRDYYEALGVARQATEKDIRQAYRRHARKHHPDLNPGDKGAAARFKEIQEAYDVLSDKERRGKYDRYGHAWERAGQAARARAGARSGPGGFSWTTGQPGGPDFETIVGGPGGFGGGLGDLLDSLLGGSGSRRRGRSASADRLGADVEHPVEITLQEAISGTARTLDIQQPDGRTRKLEVKIPSGVTEGSRIRVAGQGNPGLNGRPPGDLFLVVTLQPDPRFEKKGDDLYVDVSVPLYQAVLGGEVRVPTPKGSHLALKIPPETQNGQRFRLAGQGMPTLGQSGRGDLYAEMRVQLPTDLTERERQLFADLSAMRKR